MTRSDVPFIVLHPDGGRGGDALCLHRAGGMMTTGKAMSLVRAIYHCSSRWRFRLQRLLVRRGLMPVLVGGLVAATPAISVASTLWSDAGATMIFDSGEGRDLLDGALKRDDTSSDTLYFKFHINPLSDSTTEEYFAAFQLFERDQERVGVGNALVAWAYSASFNTDAADEVGAGMDYMDLRSSNLGLRDSGATPAYELPRRGVERTLVFKVQYVAGEEDVVSVWLNPDLSAGATEILQSETLTTRFTANASFDEIRLRHGGGGDGWVFSDLAVATSFIDFVDPSSAMPRTIGSSPLFDMRRFRSQTWHRESGMPRTAIRALAQTTDGYLWLAGGDQLARFDGVRFVAFELPDASSNAPVQVLFGDAHGALWIGTVGGGLIRYAEGQFEHFTTRNGLPADTINALTEDADGRLWIATTSGLKVWRDGRIKSIESAGGLDGVSVTALFHDGSGDVWAGVEGRGVFCFHEGQLIAFTDPEVDDLLRDPQCLLLDRERRIWIGAGADIVLCRDGDQWHRFRIPQQTRTPHVRVLQEGADGTVWAGSTSEGLFLFQDGKLTALDSSAGLYDNQISSLLLDRQGNVWAGGGGGLHLLRREHSFSLGQAEGLAHGSIASVAEVSKGVIWVVQPGRGLHRWEGRSFRRFRAAGLNPEDTTLGAMLVTRDGGCWIACAEGLRLYRDPQAVADESLLFALPGVHITSLAEDYDGSIWAGTGDGEVWRLEHGRWSLRLELSSRAPICALVPEPGGLVWAGTDGDGLYLIDGQIHAQFTISDGLPDDSIRALHRDLQGRLWIGTGRGNLGCVSNDVFSAFTIGEKTSANSIQGILEDLAGHLWLSDHSGLICVRKPTHRESAAEILGVYPVDGGSSQDVAAIVGGGQSFPQGCLTSAGRLWFGRLDGVWVAEPPEFMTSTLSLILEEVLVDGLPADGFQPISASARVPLPAEKPLALLRLAPGKHQLNMHYTSPDFRAPGELQFRYRMEGLDQDWVEAGPRRTALYSYVPPGNYRFTVAVEGPNQLPSQLGMELSVFPHFWQRWWVIGGFVIGSLATIGGGARYVEKRRLGRHLRRLEQEHALERERTRIAQDLHDEMGAKLCRISYLSEHAGRLDPGSGEIKEQITAIADDSRELLHSLDEIVWVVNPRNDTLEHVASYLGQYAQNYYHGTGVECEMDISSQLPHLPLSSQVRHHLFLAVHEALTNVLKHSKATLVKLSIGCDQSRLWIRVEDNGSGFVQTKISGGENEGDGLVNMRQRMEAMGGECRMKSEPAEGTSVLFLLELEKSGKEPT